MTALSAQMVVLKIERAKPSVSFADKALRLVRTDPLATASVLSARGKSLLIHANAKLVM